MRTATDVSFSLQGADARYDAFCVGGRFSRAAADLPGQHMQVQVGGRPDGKICDSRIAAVYMRVSVEHECVPKIARIPLSSDDEKRERGTATTTETEGEGEATDEVLTPEEEKVVRARHGLAEDGDHELEFALGASEEAEAKLANLESFLVEAFQERETGKVYFSDVDPEDVSEGDEEAKRQIVEALQDD